MPCPLLPWCTDVQMYSTSLLLQVKLQDQMDDSARQPIYAMKVQMPACPWEFYICKVLQGRVAAAMRPMFLDADRLYILSGCSVMLNPYGQHGTLQDLLNSRLRAGKVKSLAAVLPKQQCFQQEQTSGKSVPKVPPSCLLSELFRVHFADCHRDCTYACAQGNVVFAAL